MTNPVEYCYSCVLVLADGTTKTLVTPRRVYTDADVFLADGHAAVRDFALEVEMGLDRAAPDGVCPACGHAHTPEAPARDHRC